MTREQDSAFQRVTKEINGGCPCACHTGIGSAASCVHCIGVVRLSAFETTKNTDANPLCAAALDAARKETK